MYCKEGSLVRILANHLNIKMPLKQTLQKLREIGLVSIRPRPIFVFLLFFAYFLIWIIAFLLYIKYEMTALKIWIIIIGILTFLTLIHALIHKYIVKILTKG